MKSHELAHWLLSQPNTEVLLSIGQGRKPIKVKTAEWFEGSLPAQDCLVVVRSQIETKD